ncbi:transcriptional regulator [Fructobacillus sp. CRL 2054]|uniref:helix-turn-helix domain-containing protein n=1 Tax=Fructobacillus sp. CRL 2054 TaxID=2763007 RepID=UPI002379CD7A|nr:helix-turn-helix domain-containing protein [Fructobacillus sp. CRL 2054]MDD9138357.1 transcriptional regulator [Fructobacillus sp. CRL 2054]
MTLLENTKKVAKLRGRSLSNVALQAGLSEKAIYLWDKNSPRSETLQKVADVLDVSTDYLLGRTNQMNSYSSKDKATDLENTTILAFDGKPIDEEDRQKLLQYARFIMQEREREGR